MKTALLAAIIVVGLAILGGMGWLAFGHRTIAQEDFEVEIQPASNTPAPAPVEAPQAAPAVPAPAAPALIIPAEAVAKPAAEQADAASTDDIVKTDTASSPVTAPAPPTEPAPAQTGVIPVPEKPAADTSAIPYNPSGEMTE